MFSPEFVKFFICVVVCVFWWANWDEVEPPKIYRPRFNLHKWEVR